MLGLAPVPCLDQRARRRVRKRQRHHLQHGAAARDPSVVRSERAAHLARNPASTHRRQQVHLSRDAQLQAQLAIEQRQPRSGNQRHALDLRAHSPLQSLAHPTKIFYHHLGGAFPGKAPGRAHLKTRLFIHHQMHVLAAHHAMQGIPQSVAVDGELQRGGDNLSRHQ